MSISGLLILWSLFVTSLSVWDNFDNSNSLFDFSLDDFPFKMWTDDEWIKPIEQTQQQQQKSDGTTKENGKQKKISPNEIEEIVKVANGVEEGNGSNNIKLSSLDFGKIDRIMADFAEFQLRPMELVNQIIEAKSLQEKAELQTISDQSLVNNKNMQFSLQKKKIFSAAKAIQTAMIGIEIALCPFDNIWQNALGEHEQLVNFVIDKFKFLAYAVMEMKRPAKEMVKVAIGMVRKQFGVSGKKRLMMALEMVNEIEEIVNKMPSLSSDNVQGNEQLVNLDFYIAFFDEILRVCSPSAVEPIAGIAPFFQKLSLKIQMFAFSLVNEFKRIRNKTEVMRRSK